MKPSQQPGGAEIPAQFDGRRWAWWSATFVAFIVAGLAAKAVAGPIDDLTTGPLGGFVVGSVIGLGQWLVLRPSGISALRVAGTAVGLAAGLNAGVLIFGTGIEISDMALLGATGGLGVGLRQCLLLGGHVRSTSLWIPVTAGLWTLGWVVTTAVGVDVEQRRAVFGASGALVVSVLGGAVLRAISGSGKPISAMAAS